MLHDNIRFLRGSVLGEYVPCSLDAAHYSQQGNRTETYSSWDILDKLICFFIPHIAMQRNPLWEDCQTAMEKSASCSIYCRVAYRNTRGEKHAVFSVSPALTGHACFLCHQHSRCHIAAEKRVLFFHTLTLSQILLRRPCFCWYQLNAVHAGPHWGRGWN